MSKPVAAVILGLLLGAPFIQIWALNTLFELGISYTLKTWAAAFFFQLMLTPRGPGTKSVK